MDARDVAETGARAALEALAVHHHEPYEHMSAAQRGLRRRLRAHGRQLGDRQDARSGSQAIDRLVHECAYEHWHGMLFARFLAENRLLIEPELGVAVTLEECEDLGKEAGADKWTMAAHFAHRMLPHVFRPAHPAFEVQLAREHRLRLEGLAESLPAGVFAATDALGWVYQFWQSRKKDEVNRSEVKIGADELPAVTQLFTEPYMVRFLLDNSLGAWWAARRLSNSDLNGAATEAELRRKAAIPGVPLDYLRFVQSEDIAESGDERSSEAAERSCDGSNGPRVGVPEEQRFEEVPSSPDEEARSSPAPRMASSKTAGPCGSVKGSSSAFPSQDTSSPAPGAQTSQDGGVLPGAGARVDRSGSPSGSSLAGSGEVHRGGHQREATPGPWRLAVGAFSAWPEHLGELKVLDPCCGSGHFLVVAFSMLVPMRMEREGLAARDAVDAVLRENLHGLELDPRCVELAAFALALAAWTYPGGEEYRPLPELNLACSGLSVGAAKERWTELAAGHHNLRIALGWMYDEFREAPVLGSLLNPAATKAANLMDWSSLSAALAKALAQEESDERREIAVAAQGLAKAAELLAGRYHWVITNVPYLTRGKQGEKLRAFCKQHYPAARNDLATVFLERCLGLCAEGGAASLVLPQNWLFLSGYRKLREKLLKTETWHLLARLGPGAFETISGEVVKAILLTLSRSHPAGCSADLFGEETSPGTMYGLDVSESRTAGEKAARLQGAAIQSIEQARQLKNPDARVVLGSSLYGVLLEKFAFAPNGMHGGDSRRFRFLFWEVSFDNVAWHHFQAAVDETVHYGGREHVFFWPDDGRIHHESPIAYVKGKAVWGKPGIVVRVMRELPVTLYSGNIFDISCVPIAPRSPEYLLPIWCFCSSPEYHDAVRRIDQKLNVTNATLAKVPFDLDHWTKVANEQYPNGLPRPYSDDPTQWIFHGHPCGSVVWDDAEKRTAHGPLRTDPTVLQVAIARLLGYRWPAERDAGMELADEQREWVRRCGTLLACADEDGIVCIPPVRGEPPAAERLLGLLAAAFGDAWNDGVLTRLLAEASRPSLEDWLRNGFFDEHCKWFHHRPFVWHIWDGRRRDGFHALVSYHKLAEGDGKGRRLLESLTYSYLGDWITRQQDGVKRGEGGADDRLAAALELKRRLAAILEGEPPFDIFVRWKPISEQPIGWEPGIDDGVRLNIRPFMADDLPGGRTGAGILRTKPNLHWKKDRGKEPFCDQERFPWFWHGGEFTGGRVNDIHLSVAEKSAPPPAAGPGRQ